MHKGRKNIGICGSQLYNQQPIQFINALRKEGRKFGYYLTALSCAFDEAPNEEEEMGNLQLFELIRYMPLEGMVILTETIKSKRLLDCILQICRSRNIPVFSIDGELAGCYNMKPDHAKGFEYMVRHVVEEHGCRRVNMLAGIKNNSFSEERVDIYRKVLQENGILVEEERIGYGDFWEMPAKEAVKKFLDSPLPLPEAIVCANDAMAIAAHTLLVERGFSVPEDMILTGFDGILNAKYHFPEFTTCSPDYARASAFIVSVLQETQSGKDFHPMNHPIEYTADIHQSCGCEPKTDTNINRIVSKLYKEASDTTWHTGAMNHLITDNLDNDDVMKLCEFLPQHLQLWMEEFRLICVKTSLLSECEIKEGFSELISLLEVRRGENRPSGKRFEAGALLREMDTIENVDIYLIRLLNFGRKAYGYSVEGYQGELDVRQIQRNNELAFSLSYSLNLIVHNAMQKKMTKKLIAANGEIVAMSEHDPMTGLYNRRGFYAKMEAVLKEEKNYGKYLHLFSIDMNKLKLINDNFGHGEGDFAITVFAKAVEAAGGDYSICARFGGDEFVCVLLREGPENILKDYLFKSINNIVAATKGVREKPYAITASIGMSRKKISSNINLEAMIAEADREMYKMKHAGREIQRKNQLENQGIVC